MFMKHPIRGIALLALFTLLIGSSVLADDGRINRAPYHFGGDTLYCTQETGCTLLDKTGHDLANWPQDDVATALTAADTLDQNVQVKDDKPGTYGPMQLWALGKKGDEGNNTLCMIGWDEWNKQNDMCFQVTGDFQYQQAPISVATKVTEDGTVVVVDNSCDKWSVGNYVALIADITKQGTINSIDLSNHTVNFSKSNIVAKCSEIQSWS